VLKISAKKISCDESTIAAYRLLAADAEGRKRELRLRTYNVTCLNEECGLMEWVNNTQGEGTQP